MLQDEQRGERRHHVHRLGQVDDRVLVGEGVVGQQAVDFELGPGARQVIGPRMHVVRLQGKFGGFAVEGAANANGGGQGDAAGGTPGARRLAPGLANAGEGANLLALGNRLVKGQ